MRKWNHLCLTAKTWKNYQSLQAFLNRYLIYSEVLSFLGTNGTSIDNALRGSLGGPDSPTEVIQIRCQNHLPVCWQN